MPRLRRHRFASNAAREIFPKSLAAAPFDMAQNGKI
jgi:hypothetical protein